MNRRTGWIIGSGAVVIGAAVVVALALGGRSSRSPGAGGDSAQTAASPSPAAQATPRATATPTAAATPPPTATPSTPRPSAGSTAAPSAPKTGGAGLAAGGQSRGGYAAAMLWVGGAIAAIILGRRITARG